MLSLAPSQKASSISNVPRVSLAELLLFLSKIFSGIAVISMVINILMLTGPIFMLQLYDRVLSSGSVPTLVVLGSLAFTLYVFFGLLDGVRSRLLLRTAQRVYDALSGRAYRISSYLPVFLGSKAAEFRPVRDVDTIRSFLSGPGPGAIFDLPWMPLYLAIIFLFHPILGWTALGGALIICALIGMNEIMSRKPVADADQESGNRAALVESGRRNAEVIQAMGMAEILKTRWESGNQTYLTRQRTAMDKMGIFGTSIKTLRFLLQSLILGVGGWLAIKQEISPGVMIAASIMTSRALAPVELAVSQWKGFIKTRQAIKRLVKVMQAYPDDSAILVDLPLPEKTLQLSNVYCGAPGLKNALVQGVSFDLQAGEGLGIIGPSGSGKSTLARAIVGVTSTLRGAVRFDGAKRDQWPPEKCGQFIGYLPQDIQLFDGSIAENIARFDVQVSSEKIIDAAKIADVHDMIVRLPDGYGTQIGTRGMLLSGGQQQRIALARALYDQPFLVVLDEPNSNLDAQGEVALTGAIQAMRERGSIVVVIAHRPSATAAVDHILCLDKGKVTAFGPKEEILQKFVRTSSGKGASSSKEAA